MPVLSLEVVGTRERLAVEPTHVVVAGYTGRDEAAVRQHIDELAAIGIAPPPAVPTLFDLDPMVLTTGASVSVPGTETSGEVEPVYVRHAGRWYLGIGSDHTDRALERVDIHRSKAACPKPMGPRVLPLPTDVVQGGFDHDWDRGLAMSSVDGHAYQRGSLAGLRPPSDLLPRVLRHVDGGDDLVVFAGTPPLLAGAFSYGTYWDLQLELPEVSVSHTYTVVPGPVSV